MRKKPSRDACRREAEVERARATLAQLGVSDTGEMIVRAPLAGIVLTREAVPGSVVEAGEPLLMITDPSTLWLDIAATERVAPGAAVGRPGHVHGARTCAAPVRGDHRERRRRARPDDANAAGARRSDQRLRSASPGDVRHRVMLPLGDARAGVSVPDGAMQLLDQRPVVFVAIPDADGGARFERRDVEVGARAQRTTCRFCAASVPARSSSSTARSP